MSQVRPTRQAVTLLMIVCLVFGAARAQEKTAKMAQSGARQGQPRVVLVLGSGGARGLAHVGVLQVLEQAGIPIDLIVGASAGSIVGALYADRADAAALRDLFTDVKRKDFVDFSVWHLLDGPITGDALIKFLQTNMQGGDFRDLKIPFVAVATDLGKGEVFPIESGPVAPAVHASAALPPYFRSVQLQGRTLVDGGVTAPLPVNVALNYHPQFVIAVNVSGSLPPTMPKNGLSEVARSYSITLDVLGRLNGQKADVVISPDVDDAKTFNVSDTSVLFDAGAKAANEALPKIEKLLAEKGIVSRKAK